MKTPPLETTYLVRRIAVEELVTVVCLQCDRERSGVPQWFGGIAEHTTHVHTMRRALRATCREGTCPQPEV